MCFVFCFFALLFLNKTYNSINVTEIIFFPVWHVFSLSLFLCVTYTTRVYK